MVRRRGRGHGQFGLDFTTTAYTVIIFAWIFFCATTLGQEKYRGHYDSKVQLTKKLSNGKNEMDMLVMRSKLPTVGQCWKDALEDLHASCGELDDEMQSRLALSFTSCFIEMTGGSNHICEKSTPIKNCLSTLDKLEMDTFRDYFLHTQDMCYYIQSQIWHEETDRAVNELQFAALEMEKTVKEQKSIADSILESQHNSHSVQREMLKENYEMFEKVVKIKNNLEDFGAEAREHRIIFSEIFEKLRRMQDLVVWIQGEMSLLDLLTFYAGGAVFAYFLTATERSHGARLWMIMTLVAGLCGERYLYGHYTASNGVVHMTPEEILVWIQYYRKVVAACCATILLFHLAMYRDLQVINNSLLMNMSNRMDEFKAWSDQVNKSITEGQPVLERLDKIIANHALNQAFFPTLLNEPPAPPAVLPAGEETDDDDQESVPDRDNDDPYPAAGESNDQDQGAVRDRESDSSEYFDSGEEDEENQDRVLGLLSQPEAVRIPFFSLQHARNLCTLPMNPFSSEPHEQESDNNPKEVFGDSNGTPDRPAVAEFKYNLRERKPGQSPYSRGGSVEPQPSKPKAKRGGGKKAQAPPPKPIGGYYSSDDD